MAHSLNFEKAETLGMSQRSLKLGTFKNKTETNHVVYTNKLKIAHLSHSDFTNLSQILVLCVLIQENNFNPRFKSLNISFL